MSGFEIKQLKSVLDGFDKSLRVLDVGCGYGNKLEILRGLGFNNISGVEKNEALVARVRDSGYKVYTVEEFSDECADEKFDVILMSHIIEHFQYDDLIHFLEFYVSRLTVGGNLVVVTPGLNPSFYNDFDHVKPYSPLGITQVFGNSQLQFQYYSDYVLEMKNVLFIRQPFQLKYYRSIFFKTNRYSFARIINRLLYVLYRFSGRNIGYLESWIGVFERTK